MTDHAAGAVAGPTRTGQPAALARLLARSRARDSPISVATP